MWSMAGALARVWISVNDVGCIHISFAMHTVDAGIIEQLFRPLVL